MAKSQIDKLFEILSNKSGSTFVRLMASKQLASFIYDSFSVKGILDSYSFLSMILNRLAPLLFSKSIKSRVLVAQTLELITSNVIDAIQEQKLHQKSSLLSPDLNKNINIQSTRNCISNLEKLYPSPTLESNKDLIAFLSNSPDGKSLCRMEILSKNLEMIEEYGQQLFNDQCGNPNKILKDFTPKGSLNKSDVICDVENDEIIHLPKSQPNPFNELYFTVLYPNLFSPIYERRHGAALGIKSLFKKGKSIFGQLWIDFSFFSELREQHKLLNLTLTSSIPKHSSNKKSSKYVFVSIDNQSPIPILKSHLDLPREPIHIQCAHALNSIFSTSIVQDVLVKLILVTCLDQCQDFFDEIPRVPVIEAAANALSTFTDSQPILLSIYSKLADPALKKFQQLKSQSNLTSAQKIQTMKTHVFTLTSSFLYFCSVLKTTNNVNDVKEFLLPIINLSNSVLVLPLGTADEDLRAKICETLVYLLPLVPNCPPQYLQPQQLLPCFKYLWKNLSKIPNESSILNPLLHVLDIFTFTIFQNISYFAPILTHKDFPGVHYCIILLFPYCNHPLASIRKQVLNTMLNILTNRDLIDSSLLIYKTDCFQLVFSQFILETDPEILLLSLKVWNALFFSLFQHTLPYQAVSDSINAKFKSSNVSVYQLMLKSLHNPFSNDTTTALHACHSSLDFEKKLVQALALSNFICSFSQSDQPNPSIVTLLKDPTTKGYSTNHVVQLLAPFKNKTLLPDNPSSGNTNSPKRLSASQWISHSLCMVSAIYSQIASSSPKLLPKISPYVKIFPKTQTSSSGEMLIGMRWFVSLRNFVNQQPFWKLSKTISSQLNKVAELGPWIHGAQYSASQFIQLFSSLFNPTITGGITQETRLERQKNFHSWMQNQFFPSLAECVKKIYPEYKTTTEKSITGSGGIILLSEEEMVVFSTHFLSWLQNIVSKHSHFEYFNTDSYESCKSALIQDLSKYFYIKKRLNIIIQACLFCFYVAFNFQSYYLNKISKKKALFNLIPENVTLDESLSILYKGLITIDSPILTDVFSSTFALLMVRYYQKETPVISKWFTRLLIFHSAHPEVVRYDLHPVLKHSVSHRVISQYANDPTSQLAQYSSLVTGKNSLLKLVLKLKQLNFPIYSIPQVVRLFDPIPSTPKYTLAQCDLLSSRISTGSAFIYEDVVEKLIKVLIQLTDTNPIVLPADPQFCLGILPWRIYIEDAYYCALHPDSKKTEEITSTGGKIPVSPPNPPLNWALPWDNTDCWPINSRAHKFAKNLPSPVIPLVKSIVLCCIQLFEHPIFINQFLPNLFCIHRASLDHLDTNQLIVKNLITGALFDHFDDEKLLPICLFALPLVLAGIQNQQTRFSSSSIFRKIVQLLPLESTVKPTYFSPDIEKLRPQQRQFISQLLYPGKDLMRNLDLKIHNGSNTSEKITLRSYQNEGVSWLLFLYEFSLNGILCDDMGLGKTLQSLCLFAWLAKHKSPRYPSLVICPASVISHWIAETKRFFPKILNPIGIFPGQPPSFKYSDLHSKDVVICSYLSLRKNISVIRKGTWNYCILDEGHMIKDPKSTISINAKNLDTKHRLILTGTPIQRNITDLWNLFDFLMPGYLGSQTEFSLKYSPQPETKKKKSLANIQVEAIPDSLEKDSNLLDNLHKQILPFILRRLKSSVLKDLPKKIIQDVLVPFNSFQKILYNQRFGPMNTNENILENQVEPQLRFLKKLTTHPTFVIQEFESQLKDTSSVLFKKLFDILKKKHSNPSNQQILANVPHYSLFTQWLMDPRISPKMLGLRDVFYQCGIGQEDHLGHRCLIFFQSKSSISLVEQLVFKRLFPSIRYLRLDGDVDVSKRQNIVDTFNNDPTYEALLLTTKAGGLGLNLVGANVVIFMEHDVNPSNDIQAMDRAHRIGQKRCVQVYRLISKDTLESKFCGLEQFKKNISENVITKDGETLASVNKSAGVIDVFESSEDSSTTIKSKSHRQQAVENIDSESMDLLKFG